MRDERCSYDFLLLAWKGRSKIEKAYEYEYVLSTHGFDTVNPASV